MAIAAFLRALRTALWQSLANDVLDTAKATAYSGMLMLFPGFLVLTTLLAVIPAGNSLLDELRLSSEQFLPADTMSLLQSYFVSRHTASVQVLFSAITLTIFAAWGVMSTLMAGFRRAYRLSRLEDTEQMRQETRRHRWKAWQRRVRALLLVPIALIPLSLASAILIFGKPIEFWMIDNAGHDLRPVVLVLWRLVRWSLALLTSIAVLGTVFHFGTDSKESWRCVVPGAITATLLWFPVTLAFGVYVTRLADYSVIYGSLGTAIATLVWLYLTSFSVLLGAQLNGVLFRERRKNLRVQRAAERSAPEVVFDPATKRALGAAFNAERAETDAVDAAQPAELSIENDPDLPREMLRRAGN
jgi:membrane protein